MNSSSDLYYAIFYHCNFKFPPIFSFMHLLSAFMKWGDAFLSPYAFVPFISDYPENAVRISKDSFDPILFYFSIYPMLDWHIQFIDRENYFNFFGKRKQYRSMLIWLSISFRNILILKKRIHYIQISVHYDKRANNMESTSLYYICKKEEVF